MSLMASASSLTWGGGRAISALTALASGKTRLHDTDDGTKRLLHHHQHRVINVDENLRSDECRLSLRRGEMRIVDQGCGSF